MGYLFIAGNGFDVAHGIPTKYSDFFKKLNHNVDKIFSYGFSYGKVDSVYIERIVTSVSPGATWYFTKFEAKDGLIVK